MKNKRSLIKFIIGKNIKVLLMLSGLLLALALLQVKVTILLMDIIDHVIPEGDMHELGFAIAGYIALCFLQCAVGFLQAYANFIFSMKMELKITPKVVKDILNKPGAFFVENNGGELLQVVMGDVTQATNFIIMTILSVMNVTFSFVTAMVYLLTLNWKICLIILAVQPVFLIVRNILNPKLEKYSVTQRETVGRYVLSIQDIFTQPMNIILSGYKNSFTNRLNEKMQENFNVCKKVTSISLLNMELVSFLNSLTTCAVVGLCGYAIIKGHMTVGALVSFMSYSQKLVAGVENLWSTSIDISKIKPIYGKVNRFFVEESIKRDGDINNSDTPNIEINNISFSYDGSKKIYNELNYNFEYGKKYGIVGRTGEGKSTLVKLLYDLWEADKGEIKLGGTNCKGIDQSQVSEILSYASPDSIIVEDTIYNNVLMGTKGASKEDVIKALKQVCLYDEVMEMENGIDTIIGDKGISLSSGQQQRLMLARTIIANKKIVILDEPTAALDASTEKSVMAALYKEFADKLLIIISHNKSVLYDCDEIVRLDGGKFQTVEA